jgi:sulfite reductase (ferredoxin)
MITELSPVLDVIDVDEHSELDVYESQIRKYRSGELDETKMQKWRLHFGTYAQRQEGVQMQRIKIPGGFLTAPQLDALAQVADRYASGFMHFTTREDAQLYYIRLEDAPNLLRLLGGTGLTGREACGNTVRNITACYRAGTALDEAFDVWPYAQALFKYLVRNKYNQNLGRKFKIAFEGCQEDHSSLRIHDIGFHAVTRQANEGIARGFRVFLGGGLGAAPQEARLYTEFLPETEIFAFATAILRLFDRYGERKSRMKARMKFLINTMGWDAFRQALDSERENVGEIPFTNDDIDTRPLPRNPLRTSSGGNQGAQLRPLDSRTGDKAFRLWAIDSVLPHRIDGLRGVLVRLKHGDLTSESARKLARIAGLYSAGQLRVTIDQNLFLPWVREESLVDLFHELQKASLEDSGAATIEDITACPGSDTCRLGIASAKGVASALQSALENSLSRHREIARDVKLKVSGCPNGCAQHSIAGIGFQAAALSRDGKTVPAHMLSVGGKADMEGAEFGRNLGKFPAKNCVAAVGSLLDLYRDEREPNEEFNQFVRRMGEATLKERLAPFQAVPAFDDDPSFYEDYGHENERFTIRPSLAGECAGSTVAETVPKLETAHEWLAQGEAYFYHKEYVHAGIAAYEAAAAAARVPLYRRLVDPFTSDEALWEFENLFVLSGESNGEWAKLSEDFATRKRESIDENGARDILDFARLFVTSVSM